MVSILLSILAFLGAPANESYPLVSSAGASVQLADIAPGQVVVMVVMKGTWCPVCVEELKTLWKHSTAFRRLDGHLVGLNVESPPRNKKARAARGLNPELYSDPHARFLRSQNLWLESAGHPMPGLVILNRCGQVHRVLPGRAPGFSARSTVIAILEKLKAKPAVCQQLI